MKAAVYLRVSTDEQNPENQRAEVEGMARGRGYEVVGTYVDTVSGAKGRDERPQLAALLDDAARGKFQAVFVWRLDRFSRDDSFLGGVLMIGELDRFGVALLSHQETYIDTAGPFRRPLVQIALTLAAEERRTLIERTKRGIARAKRQGVHTGRPGRIPPTAVQRAEELRRGIMFTDQPHQPPTCAGGLSWRQVVAELKREGFGEFSRGAIERAVRRYLSQRGS